MQKNFTYKFNDGPLPSQEALLGDWSMGNCRRAVQLYIFDTKNIFLKPEQVLCPQAYNETGTFIITAGQNFSTDQLIDGDIIYAEKIRNKEETLVDKSRQTFATEDDYIISLHTALFTGEAGR